MSLGGSGSFRGVRTALRVQRSLVFDVNIGKDAVHMRHHPLALVRRAEDADGGYASKGSLAERRAPVVERGVIVTLDEVDGAQPHAQEAVRVYEGGGRLSIDAR
jgi:hypothetical protein